MTPDQIDAINRLAQRGYGIDRIDDIIPDAKMVGRTGHTAICQSDDRVQRCTIFCDARVGDSVVCAKVKLYDRPAMRWFAFKSDRAWVLDELTKLGQERGYDNNLRPLRT